MQRGGGERAEWGGGEDRLDSWHRAVKKSTYIFSTAVAARAASAHRPSASLMVMDKRTGMGWIWRRTRARPVAAKIPRTPRDEKGGEN